jgi:hypothetical protein
MIIRTAIAFSIAFLSALPAVAQPFHIAWLNTIGGTNEESAYQIVESTEGGVILVGETRSNDGDIVGSYHGRGSVYSDMWVIKCDRDGSIVWTRVLGGRVNDPAHSVVALEDGGCLVVGTAGSSEGTVPEKTRSGNACWALRLDSEGGTMWSKAYMTNLDEGMCVVRTKAGFLIAGESEVRSGDGWLMMLNDTGKLLWEKTYGGSNTDQLRSVIPTSDGGYLAVGTSSSDYLGGAAHGGDDAWVIKVAYDGDMEWQHLFGGPRADVATSVVETSDHHYMVVGYSHTSNDPKDIPGSRGYMDGFAIRLDSSGTTEWIRIIGGKGDDYIHQIIPIGGERYMAVGTSSSNDGDGGTPHGDIDCWILQIDSSATVLAKQCIGGTGQDRGYSIAPAGTNGYLVCGETYSSDGDITQPNRALRDVWYARLGLLSSVDDADTPRPTTLDLSWLYHSSGGTSMFGRMP